MTTNQNQNQVPVRPATRDAVYDILDGERDYQNAGQGNAERHPTEAKAMSVGEFLLCMEDYMHKARARWSKKDGVPPALDNLRKVVALGVHCMELHGAVPRANHVPASAGITGTADIVTGPDSTEPQPAAAPAAAPAATEPQSA